MRQVNGLGMSSADVPTTRERDGATAEPDAGATVSSAAHPGRAARGGQAGGVGVALRGALGWASPTRFSALYVWIGLVVVFSIWVPDTFLTATNLKIVISEQAVTAMVALGLTVALAAGVLDLSVASVLGFCGMIAAILMVNYGHGSVSAVVIALLCGAVIGAANAVLVTWLRVSSIIATLGVSSVLAGLVVALSDNQNVIGLREGFLSLGTETIVGIALPVWIMFAVAVAMWFVLEHTVAGRYLYATGAGPEAARLAGISTTRYVAAALVVCATLSALAGVLGTARIGAGDPGLGPAYLLPAFAAAFLGSTQIKPGKFNAWGTVAAVYVLATGVKGLQLAGAPTWLPDVFTGCALLLAVGLTAARDRFGIVARSRQRHAAGNTRAA